MFSPSRIEDIRTRQSISISVMAPVFLISVATYLLFINILVQIGMAPTAIDSLVLMIIFAVCIYGALSGRSMEVSQHVLAGKQVEPLANAMAGSVEWIGVFFLIGITAILSRSNHEAIAIMGGVIAGLSLMAIVVVPALSRQKSESAIASLPQLLALRLPARGDLPELFRMASALIISFCAGLLLITQINTGGWVLSLFFPQVEPWAKLILILPPILLLIAGGMRAVTITNALLFWLVLGAMLLPTAWISLQLSGNPIPQLGYGGDALRAIVEIDQQFQNAPGGNLSDSFGQVSGIVHFLGILICVMAGSAAYPLLFGRVVCCQSQAQQGKSLAWMIILVAILFSLVPAFVVFAKFEIYRDLIGLAILDIPDSTQWIFNWASIDDGKNALICGQPAFDVATITQSCGGDGNHILSPNDLSFSAQLMVLGLGEIAQLPQIVSAMLIVGVVAAALSTIAMSLMVMANTLTHDLFFAMGKDVAPQSDGINFTARAPIIRRLFIARLLIVALGLWATWISDLVTIPSADLFVWVFSLSAVMFVATLVILWWRGTTALGSIIGVITGFGVTLYLQIQLVVGSDFIAKNGDELILHLPFSDYPLSATDTGLIGMPVTLVIIVSISMLQNWQAYRKRINLINKANV